MPLLHIEPLPRRASKPEILDFLDRVGGLDRKRVGRIEFRGPAAVVEVPDGWEARLLKALDGQMFGDRRVRVRIAADRRRRPPGRKTISPAWPGSWTWKAGPRPSAWPSRPENSRPPRPRRPATA